MGSFQKRSLFSDRWSLAKQTHVRPAAFGCPAQQKRAGALAYFGAVAGFDVAAAGFFAGAVVGFGAPPAF